MHVSIFCFSLPVLNAVAFFDDCFFFSQQPKQKRRVLRGELDLAVLPSFAQSKRKKRGLISWWWCLRVGVCLRFACVSMCVGFVVVLSWGRGVRLSIVFAPAGAWIVCVFVSSALSLSVLSHCLALADPLTCFDLHLNLITFTRKYYLYYVCFASFNL